MTFLYFVPFILFLLFVIPLMNLIFMDHPKAKDILAEFLNNAWLKFFMKASLFIILIIVILTLTKIAFDQGRGVYNRVFNIKITQEEYTEQYCKSVLYPTIEQKPDEYEVQ